MKSEKPEWYKETEYDLSMYSVWCKKVEAIELKMIVMSGPITKVTASYGDSGGVCNSLVDDEEMLAEYQYRIKLIDVALSALTPIQQNIVELKYFKDKKDYIIYQEYLPMSSKTFYINLQNAIETIAIVVGKKK